MHEQSLSINHSIFVSWFFIKIITCISGPTAHMKLLAPNYDVTIREISRDQILNILLCIPRMVLNLWVLRIDILWRIPSSINMLIDFSMFMFVILQDWISRRGSRNFQRGGGLKRKILKEKCLLIHVTCNSFSLLLFQEYCLLFFALFYYSLLYLKFERGGATPVTPPPSR